MKSVDFMGFHVGKVHLLGKFKGFSIINEILLSQSTVETMFDPTVLNMGGDSGGCPVIFVYFINVPHPPILGVNDGH